MNKRKIIQIDEEKCTGCGKCINVCAEAALELIDGKAKVVSDFLCDGMGVCLDVCPVGALKIAEKEADFYDPQKAYRHVSERRGERAAEKIHGIEKVKGEDTSVCGCPGTMAQDFRKNKKNISEEKSKNVYQGEKKSALNQWPIQLNLLNPKADYFYQADLLIAADCVPFTYANFHQRFLKDKILIIFCPKLDEGIEEYIEKLSIIFEKQEISSITIVHMEVPCCSGIERIVRKALQKSEKNIFVNEYTISLQGKII